MRRNVVVATVLAAALVGVVGAEGIIKAREAALPKGTITVEELNPVLVEATRLDMTEQLPTTATAAR